MPEIEVQDRHGKRPIRLRLDPDGLSFDRGDGEPMPVPSKTDRWFHIKMVLDCAKKSYDTAVDGKPGNPALYQEDLPVTDYKFAESIFLIDALITSN